MFADRVKSFVCNLTDMTNRHLLTWERFPQHYPFQNNLFIQDFIQKHPEMDQSRSYFLSHKNGLVLFIRCTSGKAPESVHLQKHFGEPIVSLTQEYQMADIVSELGKAIDDTIKLDEALPDGIYLFMCDVEKGYRPLDAE